MKTRICSQVDCDPELIREFNNGWIDVARLQKMSKMMKDASYELLRQYSFKLEAIEKAQTLKLVLDSVATHKQDGRPCAIYDGKKEPHFSEERICSRFANRLEYFWLIHVTPILFLSSGVLMSLMTVLVIFFEISLYLSLEDSNLYNQWTNFSKENKGSSFFLANLFCIVPLSYICASSYFGLFRIKVQSIYALHSNQQTDPPCLVFSGMLLMRLAIAVAYNFLELSRVKQCAFFEVMGPLVKIQFLGEGFNRWIFPSLLILTILLTAFDCFGRILNCVGLRQFAFDEEYAEEKVIEGNTVIERHLKAAGQ